jgi:hypothetical protein
MLNDAKMSGFALSGNAPFDRRISGIGPSATSASRYQPLSKRLFERYDDLSAGMKRREFLEALGGATAAALHDPGSRRITSQRTANLIQGLS